MYNRVVLVIFIPPPPFCTFNKMYNKRVVVISRRPKCTVHFTWYPSVYIFSEGLCVGPGTQKSLGGAVRAQGSPSGPRGVLKEPGPSL